MHRSVQDEPLELVLQSLPASAEQLKSVPSTQLESAAGIVVTAIPLETPLLEGLPVPEVRFYSTDPAIAAASIQNNPELLVTMIKGLAARIIQQDSLSMADAKEYVLGQLEVDYNSPLLDSLEQLELQAKRARAGPEMPKQADSLGMKASSYTDFIEGHSLIKASRIAYY